MYGKVLVASGSAYFLTFEHHVAPQYVGLGVLVMSGIVVAADIKAEGPQHRLEAFVHRCRVRNLERVDRARRKREVLEAAEAELQINNGIRMPEELAEADREWLREQAALAIARYES